MGCVFQHHRRTQARGRFAHDHAFVRTAQTQFGKGLVEFAGAFDNAELLADEHPVGFLRDPHKPHARSERYDGHTRSPPGLSEHFKRAGAGEPHLVNCLNREPHGPGPARLVEKSAGVLDGVLEGRRGRQQHLPAFQQVGDCVSFSNVDPADRGVEVLFTCENYGIAEFHLGKLQEVPHGQVAQAVGFRNRASVLTSTDVLHRPRLSLCKESLGLTLQNGSWRGWSAETY